MAWSKYDQVFALAHFQRLGAGALAMFVVCAFCLELWSIIFMETAPGWRTLFSLVGLGRGSDRLKAVTLAWVATCLGAAARYPLLSADLGLRVPPSVLATTALVFFQGAVGGVLGTCLAAAAPAAAACAGAHRPPLAAAAAAALAALAFAWSGGHEVPFPGRAPSFTEAAAAARRLVENALGGGGALALALAGLRGLGAEGALLATRLGALFAAALAPPPPPQSLRAVVCPGGAATGGLLVLLADGAAAAAALLAAAAAGGLLRTLPGLPLDFRRLAELCAPPPPPSGGGGAGAATKQGKGKGKGPGGEAAVRAAALALGREGALAALARAAAAETQAAGGAPPGWRAEAALQAHAAELAAADARAPGGLVGRAAPRVGQFQAGLPLWARCTRVLAAQDLARRVTAPDAAPWREGRAARAAVYGRGGGGGGGGAWPEEARLLLLSLDALGLQLQVLACQADPAGARRALGVPAAADVAWLPAEVLARCAQGAAPAAAAAAAAAGAGGGGLAEAVPLWRDLKKARAGLARALEVRAPPPRLTRAQAALAGAAADALAALLAKGAAEHPRDRCRALAGSALRSLAGLTLAADCFRGTAAAAAGDGGGRRGGGQGSGGGAAACPALGSVVARAEEGLRVLLAAFGDALPENGFPEPYARVLRYHLAAVQAGKSTAPPEQS